MLCLLVAIVILQQNLINLRSFLNTFEVIAQGKWNSDDFLPTAKME